MPSYTAITNTQIDQDSPVTQPLLTALRDNPEAMAGRGSGAPVVEGGWVPYDMAAYGDGADGKVYDFSVDGAVASIVTPTFAAGFEYLVVTEDLNPFDIEFHVNGTSYVNRYTATATYAVWANLLISRFDESLRLHAINGTGSADRGAVMVDHSCVNASSTAFTVSDIRLTVGAGGNFSSGRVYMYKRGFTR